MLAELKEVAGGPYGISRRHSGGDEKIGYAWFETGEGTQNAYFVLKDGTKFPLEYGAPVVFSPQAMPNVSDPEQFYEWVENNGELGADPECWSVEETFGTWNP